MKVIAIIQARMGSTRLPGKVLKQVLGKPLLQYQIERVKRSKYIDEIVIATTNQKNDDDIAKFCRTQKIPIYRGSEHDVLQRFVETARHFNAETIVRLTADCPLIDPVVIDQVIGEFVQIKHPLLYVSNTLERSFPRGMDVEVFSYEGLKKVEEAATSTSDREHVTSYFGKHPQKFHLVNVSHEKDLSAHRWTVDTIEDFTLVKNILEAVYPKNKNFTLSDILEVLKVKPTWSSINAHIEQKKI